MNVEDIKVFRENIVNYDNRQLLEMYKDLGKQIKSVLSDLSKYESEENYNKVSEAMKLKYLQDVVFDRIIGDSI